MSEEKDPKPGTIAWSDLTVRDAEGIRRFYEPVAGWRASPVDMGGLVVKPRGVAGGRFCVIRDPAGAVCALFQPPR